MNPATYCSCPGNRPERLRQGAGGGADAVVLDLEDAVAPDDKARRAMPSRLGAPPTRERAASCCAHQRRRHRLPRLLLPAERAHRGVMLPKAESAAQVRAVRAAVPDARCSR
jgi:citrate lyase subunit beta/citryl-CoA lyase